jgi:predicted Kef-type K+ transport protein
MTEAIWITLAFILGMAFRQFGLPPLVGYLAAGFALNGIAHLTGKPLHGVEALHQIAHLGVLLLLFIVGLKLRLRNVLQPEVLGGSLAHLAIVCLLLTPAMHYLAGLPWETALLLTIALSFSSTVVAAKVLEAKRELRAFHGRVAIGILIVQDVVALTVMSVAGGHTPSLFAFAVLALVIGGFGFESVGLSAELGALLLGAVLASHSRAQELAKALWGIKEIFLIGFFLEIGMSGLPTLETVAIALLLLLLLPLKTGLFFLILLKFKLRARSSFLTGLSLTSYSEFALIMAAVLLPDWTVVLALTVALSFVIAAPLNRFAHPLFERLEQKLVPFELDQRHTDEQPVSLGRARILIMGMGRTGSAAYDFLKSREERIVGLDADPGRVEANLHEGRRVLYADAEDPGFWHDINLDMIKAVLLAMNDTEAKVIAARQLRRRGYEGFVVATSYYNDEAKLITEAGADMTFLTFSEAGVGLAEHVWQALYGDDIELHQRELAETGQRS